MQSYRPGIAVAGPAVSVSVAVLLLTGGLVGVMAYTGSVAPFVWVLVILLGVWLHGRLPRSTARWRGAVAAGSLFAAAGILGWIAYHGAFDTTPAFVGACLIALALAPETSA
jgi:hypothetical protein